jgi:hypothetical protein
MPYFEPSRPMPLSFMPPKGAISVEMRPSLMPTMPYSGASATGRYRVVNLNNLLQSEKIGPKSGHRLKDRSAEVDQIGCNKSVINLPSCPGGRPCGYIALGMGLNFTCRAVPCYVALLGL